MTNIVVGYDCTHANLPAAEKLVPAGSLFAGYDTGSADIVWTPADRARHPGSLHIDQDVLASDFTSDYLDVEGGAATPADAPKWSTRAMSNFSRGTRPGQRQPAIYMSAVNVTSVVNALIAGHVTSGVGLIVADWNLSEPQAVQDVMNAAGPFPIVGVQFRNAGPFDINIFSGAYVSNVSGRPVTPLMPPGQWNDPHTWTWGQVGVIGSGLDGRIHAFFYDAAHNVWVKAELCVCNVWVKAELCVYSASTGAKTGHTGTSA